MVLSVKNRGGMEINMSEENLSMADFEAEINNSFKKLKEGDLVKGTVIGISETEAIIDLNYYAEGIIKLEDLSNDPAFSIKADLTVGDEISACVIGENRDGNILLSRKQAEDVLSWDRLKEDFNNKTVLKVKVSKAVNGGVTTYVYGMRGFIPASQLALEYVEDTSSYIGRELEAVITTCDKTNEKLVLSAKEILRNKVIADKTSRISKLQTGLVTKGTVEKIMPFGAFVNIGEDLTGLVHISQICGRKIKSPSEVLKVGDEVTVKILDNKDGKISLSIKAVEEDSEIVDDAADAPIEFSTGEEATTGLGALLKGLKL